MDFHSKRGLTWIEWLVIIALLAILASFLMPTSGVLRLKATRTVAASNIRQLGHGALIYANDNRGQLPGLNLNQLGEIDEESTTPNLHAIAAALAVKGGINDASYWIAPEDRNPNVNREDLTVVLHSGPPRSLSPEFSASALSFQFIAGLNTEMATARPIAFTRGLQPNGLWAEDVNQSVNGKEGGHIVFLGGNVRFFKTLRQDETYSQKEDVLKTPTGAPTANVLETIDSTARIFSHPATATGAMDGMPGIAP